MIDLSDIVKVADEEWEFVTGTFDFAQGAAKIRERGPKLVVMTRGAQGASWNCEAGQGEVAGFAAKAIDTLGAGDSFVAGMLYQVAVAASLDAVLNADSMNEILRFANACGAIATQQAGAIPALPTRGEVEALIAG